MMSSLCELRRRAQCPVTEAMLPQSVDLCTLCCASCALLNRWVWLAPPFSSNAPPPPPPPSGLGMTYKCHIIMNICCSVAPHESRDAG